MCQCTGLFLFCLFFYILNRYAILVTTVKDVPDAQTSNHAIHDFYGGYFLYHVKMQFSLMSSAIYPAYFFSPENEKQYQKKAKKNGRGGSGMYVFCRHKCGLVGRVVKTYDNCACSGKSRLFAPRSRRGVAADDSTSELPGWLRLHIYGAAA